MSDIKQNISLDGISFRKLIKYRPFNIHFSVEHLMTKDLLFILRNEDNADILDDLKVRKPHVTDITNKRLNLRFPVRNLESEFAEFQLESDMMADDQKDTDSSYDLIGGLLNFDFTGTFDVFTDQIGGFHDVWMDPGFDLNLISTMTKQKIAYQPKKILERIINLKYIILVRLVAPHGMINKKAIIAIKRQTGSDYLKYAMIYSYDRQFSNVEAPSPNGCDITIDPQFDEIYKVNMPDDLNDDDDNKGNH